ncbi:hypothetical protein PCIT_a2978 [Pseudoalteromonas citrea]|uniref:Carrier domain-containing protein n=2 Tax=Pseudoalteromonas citrea TaxID=43655 RepID=A0AAD4FRM1_9GAMM|nr:non-ribosomal peptide synthetase [Pseudoalteromonas citrea]KAF7770032.1 hypothetical protein PCIT_a2978 [Pseudoalteromonas citrea]
MNALELLYKVNDLQMLLWVESGDKLKFKLRQPLEDKTYWFDLIKANKQALIDILLQAGIEQEPRALPQIYRCGDTIKPMSYAQQRLWFIEQLEQGSNAYTIPLCLYVPHFDAACFERAITYLVTRHSVLNSVFVQHNSNAQQQVLRCASVSLIHHETNTQSVTALLGDDIQHIFNLTDEPPVRISHYHISDAVASEQNVVLINIHHIAFDGWSAGVFLAELKQVYEAQLQGQSIDLPTLRFEYADYAYWQNHQKDSAQWQKQITFWRSHLAGAETLNLPLDKPRPEKASYAGKNIPFELSLADSAALSKLAQAHGASLYSLLLSSFVMLLSKLANQTDIVTGSVVANREIEGTESLVGFFTNTQATRHDVDPSISCSELVKQTHAHVIDALKHQELPFDVVVDALDLDRTLNMHPLFQVLFCFDKADEADTTQFVPYPLAEQYQVAKYDLSLYLTDSNGVLSGYFNYASALFDDETVQRIVARYQRVLAHYINDMSHTVSQVDVVLEEERAFLHQHGCDTYKALPEHTVTALFTEAAAASPAHCALKYKQQQMSYQALDEYTNQLAHWITHHVDEPRKSVFALVMERSLEMIPAILAIHKVGAAYVPIDPALPKARKAFILADTQAQMILSLQYEKLALLDELPELDPNNVVAINSLYILDQLKAPVACDNALQDLAYLIYTSGTTGQPKGVMLSHLSLLNRIDWMQSTYPLTPSDIVLQKTPYNFDVSVWELIWAHCYGASVVMAPPNVHKDPQRLYQLIEQEGVSVVHFVPSMFNLFLQDIQQRGLSIPKSLRYIFTSGEALALPQVELFNALNHHQLGGCQLHNLYGPTETAIDSTYYPCAAVKQSVPIGKPIQNTLVYALDDQQRQVPIGTEGELYIAGTGVAKGYLNRDELTQARFLANPFFDPSCDIMGANRMYKTGDKVKFNREGELLYLGRSDFQIKLHGLRIELTEIEVQLCQHPQVLQALVNVVERGNDQVLVGYYVAKEPISDGQLERTLEQNLPDYMVPKVFVHLAQFPLSANGKLDRKALKPPTFASDNYQAPQSEQEILVAQIWAAALKLERVGVHDDFFKLGGNSILAISLCQSMSQKLERQISLALLFKAKTISAVLAQCGTGARRRIAVRQQPHANLSFSQQRLWFVHEYEQGTHAFNIPLLLKLTECHVPSLEVALKAIVNRHQILRSIVKSADDEQVQVVLPEAHFELEHVRLSKDGFESRVHQDINHIFDLARDLPIRAICYSVAGNSEKTTYLLINFHHIAFDGWSTGIFYQELLAYYEQAKQQKPLTLEALPIQYGDFAQWQRQFLGSDEFQRQRDYWSEKLAGYETLRLPTKGSRPAKFQYQGDNIVTTLDPDLSDQLTHFAQQQGCSLFSVMLTVFNVLLSKYSGQSDIVVGTPMANRHHPDVMQLIGLFVNTVPLRTQVNGTASLFDLLAQVTHTVEQAQHNQDVPFEQIVDDLSVPRDSSRHPIYQVMFSIDEFSEQETAHAQIGLEQVDLSPYYHVAKQDMSLYVSRNAQQLTLAMNWATALFSKASIEQFLSHYQELLSSMTAYPQQRLADFTLLSTHQQHQLIYDLNKTDSASKPSTFVHEFDAIAAAKPYSIAATYNGQSLTYQQLAESASYFAHTLRQVHQVERGELILVRMTRSLDLLVAILGILKAGAAYVPVGVDYPQARQAFIAQDTQARVICVDAHNNDVEDDERALPLRYVAVNQEPLAESFAPYCDYHVAPSDLAYVIYTSGTTGQPKGVMIEHGAFVDFLTHFEVQNACPNILSLTTFTFDIFGLEYGMPLLRGGTVTLCQLDLTVNRLKTDTTLTMIQQTPSVFRTLLPMLTGLTFPHITCLVGGEALDMDLLSKLQATFGRVINVYGPTETVIWSCAYDCTNSSNAAVIGRPLANEKCYLLDENLQPVPKGVVGELFIGGAGLARGYLNRSELTDQRFIHNPFASKADRDRGFNRLYKTGDLAFMHDDGNIQFLGRSDFQVKINGHRVETAEIEALISEFATISQVVVMICKVNQQDYLTAYFVAPDTVNIDQLRQHLRSKLPDHMIPAAFVQIAQFTLSANGKLDRKVLPIPEFTVYEYVAPVSDLEKQLCAIWQDVLTVEQVGVTDDFFMLGGNSILAIHVINKVRQQLDIEVSIHDLFEHNHIRSLIEHGLGRQAVKILPANTRRYPLSFAQQRLWFIEQFDSHSAAYQIPILLKLTDGADDACIELAIRAILIRHQVLRTCIKEDSSGFYQDVQPETVFMLKRVLVEGEPSEAQLATLWQAEFDLTRQIPLQAYIVEGKTSTYLLINIHHIAFDGWSIELFMHELNQHYCHFTLDERLSVPALPIQYKDFAVWQRAYLAEGESERQLSYWQTQLTGLPTLQLFADKPRPTQLNFSGAHVSRVLDISMSKSLIDMAKEKGVSLNTLMLSAYYLLLHKYTGQADIVLGTPVANRHINGIDQLVGFFVNTLTLRVPINKQARFDELLGTVAQVSNAAQDHQDVPFEAVVERLNLPQDGSRHPIFQLMFAQQNFGESAVDAHWYRHEQAKLDQPFAKYDLSVVVANHQGKLVCTMNYATALFDHARISQMLDHYVYILEQVLHSTEQAIKDYTVLAPAAIRTLVDGLPALAYSPDQRLEQQFSHCASKTPHANALITPDHTLSYAQLNEQANKLARYIRAHHSWQQAQLNKDTQGTPLVAVLMEGCHDLLLSQLAILKAGAAFVPIDVRNPPDRVSYILSDTQSCLLLTQRQHRDTLTDTAVAAVISVDECEYSQLPAHELNLNLSPSDLAYVIYTSGTTGQPKGVMIEHSQINYTLAEQAKNYQLTDDSVFYMGISPAFDASIAIIYGALCQGGALLLTEGVDFTSEQLQQVTHLIVAASVLDSLDPQYFPNLKCVIYGADKASDAALNAFSYANIFVEYGVTECAITSTYKAIKSGEQASIGKPLLSNHVYILDDELKPLPTGCVGEIVISGPALSRGYLNLPQQTNMSFIGNPLFSFYEQQGHASAFARVYRTGDLGRINSAGNIEFFGRRDGQVKLRGQRIELAEINKALCTLDAVVNTYTCVHHHNETELLVSYYVAPMPINEANAFAHLKQLLPVYMHPSVLVHMAAMPLTLNGKLDVAKLPEPQLSISQIVPATTPMQQSVMAAWVSLLSSTSLSILDDFFMVGGDSILSIQLSARLKRLGYQLSVKDIFTHRTIATQSALLEQQGKREEIHAEQGNLTGTFALSAIQNWFFNQCEMGYIKAPNHWNQSFLLRVPGAEIAHIQACIDDVVRQHDILRVRFEKIDSGAIVQVYNSSAENRVNLLDARHMSDEVLHRKLTEWQAEFDIIHGPLVRFGYITGIDDGFSLLYVACHHLLIDAVSWRIISDDFQACFQNDPLPEKTSSYRQWVNKCEDYSTCYPQEIRYWQQVLNCLPNIKQAAKTGQSTVGTGELSVEATTALLKVANNAGLGQVHELLLSSFAIALYQHSGHVMQGICLEGHGREAIFDELDVSRTVGWFTSYYPVLLQVYAQHNEIDIARTCLFNKELLGRIPNNGVGYALLESTLNNTHRLPQVSFNYLGQLSKQADLPWQIVSQFSGENSHSSNQSPHELAFNGAIVQGKLQFSIESKLDPHVGQTLADGICQCLAQLVQQVNTSDALPMHSPIDSKDYVPFEVYNPEASDPWFILPPAQGGSESYQKHLVPRLSNTHLVLFNNYLNTTSRELHNIDFQQLAISHIAMMKTLQPQGPYRVMGWSFGGVLALEIIKQLAVIGEQVEQLVLVDCYLNYQAAIAHSAKLQSLLSHQQLQDDINYRYTPNSPKLVLPANTHLYKAQHSSGHDHGALFTAVEQYYLATNDNHLSDYALSDTLIIEPIPCSHYEVFSNAEVVSKIAATMKLHTAAESTPAT